MESLKRRGVGRGQQMDSNVNNTLYKNLGRVSFVIYRGYVASEAASVGHREVQI
jgi:hypothetical protein